MKKFFITVFLLVGITVASLFAWEPIDLTKYPSCMGPKSWILNVGVGLGDMPILRTHYFFIPPVSVSLDKNVPLSDKGLPFFFGGFVSYWGNGFRDGKDHWYYSVLTPAVRIGYHFNWDVDKLDTYAVTKVGYKIYIGEGFGDLYKFGFPSIGVSIGARFFPLDWFGFWAEAGVGTYLYSVDLGLAFKF